MRAEGIFAFAMACFYAFACAAQLPVSVAAMDGVANLRQYGGSPQASREQNTRALQQAMDAVGQLGGIVYVPPGHYRLGDTIHFHSNVIVQGAGAGASILDSSVKGPVFGPADDQRCFHVYFRDLQITNTQKPSLASHGGIGIDFTNVSQGGVRDVKIEYMTCGIHVEGKPGGAHYLDLYSPLISTCYLGIRCQDLGEGSANETRVFAGRLADCVTAIELNGVNNFLVQGTAIETFGIGIDIQSMVSGVKVVSCRFEPVHDPTRLRGTTGIRIAANAKEVLVIGPYFENAMTHQILDHSGHAKIVQSH